MKLRMGMVMGTNHPNVFVTKNGFNLVEAVFYWVNASLSWDLWDTRDR